MSEIVNAYIENILALPFISGTQPAKVHDFYEALLYNVQSLETLGKTSECVALVRGILKRLPGIKAELVQGHPECSRGISRNCLTRFVNGRRSIP